MTVFAAFLADVDSWLRGVCRGEYFCLLFSLFTASCADIFSSPLLIPAFTTDLQCPRSSAAASHVVVSIPARFMSVSDIWTVCCVRCSDELIIQHVFRDATVRHSMDMAKPSQTPLA